MRNKFEAAIRTSHLRNIAGILLIFAILSNLLYLPCYFYIYKINRTNVIESYQKKLNSGMQLLDSSIESVLGFGVLVSENDPYKEIYYINSDIDTDVLNELRQVMPTYTTLPYNFISNFGLFQKDDLLFTKNQVYFPREYLTPDYYFSCETEEYFEQFSDKHCFLPAMHFSSAPIGEYDAVTMGYRCSAIKNMYFFIHYPVQELTALFVDDEVMETSNISIYFADTLLVSCGTQSDHNFELLTVSSNTGLDLRVKLQLSNRFIEEDLAGFKHLVQIFLVIVLLAMCLWISLFSWRIASPFNQISKILHETGHFHTQSARENSIDIMVDGIRKMGIKLSDYGRIVDEQKERSRIHILEKALYKGLYDEPSRHSFQEAFPDFPANWQLTLIQYTSDDNTVDLDSIQLLLTQYFQQKFSDITLLSYSQDTLLALFPLQEDRHLSAELEHVRNDIQTQYPVSVSFTVSQVYHNCNLLSDALQELEYELIALPHASSPDPRKDLPISIGQIQTISLALSNGDAQSAISALQNSFTHILHHNHHDVAMAKYSHKMLVYTLIRIKLEHNILDVPIPNFKEDHIRHLFEVDFPQCFEQIAVRLNQQQVNKLQDLDHNIFTFIEENISNQQLCVSMVTDHFHISAPTLQKRMNSCAGKTFSIYVEDLRMKKAHQMVQDTTLTIQEIAESVGYINGNSFYKAYKRYFGEAPRATRKNNSL